MYSALNQHGFTLCFALRASTLSFRLCGRDLVKRIGLRVLIISNNFVSVEIQHKSLALLGDTLGKAKSFCPASQLGNPLAQEINVDPVG